MTFASKAVFGVEYRLDIVNDVLAIHKDENTLILTVDMLDSLKDELQKMLDMMNKIAGGEKI